MQFVEARLCSAGCWSRSGMAGRAAVTSTRHSFTCRWRHGANATRRCRGSCRWNCAASVSRIPGADRHGHAAAEPERLDAPDNRCRSLSAATDYDELAEWRDQDHLQESSTDNPRIIVALRSDYFRKANRRSRSSVDRNRAADLGVSLTEVGRTLETMLGSRMATTFVDRGEEYNVMLQAQTRGSRDTFGPGQYLCPFAERPVELIPLANLVEPRRRPPARRSCKRFDRQRSIGMTVFARTRLLARRGARIHAKQLSPRKIPEGLPG